MTAEEIVKRLRPIDDILFQKLSENKGFCEELLQVLLEQERLELVKTTPQKNLRNIKGRSVIVDVLCEGVDRNYYNVEVQKQDNDNHEKRVRYNSSNVDTYITEKGIEYKELPDLYIIYISEFDIFKKGKTIYHVQRSIKETEDVVNNGYHGNILTLIKNT